MNDERFAEARAKIADATARLLHRFRHPKFLAGIPRELRCRRKGCFLPQSFGGMCMEHALATHESRVARPTLRNVLSDGAQLSEFVKWLQGHHPDAVRVFGFWRACLTYRETSSPTLRLGQAQRIIAKYFDPTEASASSGRRRFSCAADLDSFPPEAVHDIRRRVQEAGKWQGIDERDTAMAAARYVAASDREGFDASEVPAPSSCSMEMFDDLGREAFDRLDVLYQREYTASAEYRASMERILEAITTPRSSRID
jgi:hypothetical protein